MKSNTKTILAVITGALAGAALGVFFATRKGNEAKSKTTKSAKAGASGEKTKIAKETASELKEKIQRASHSHNHSGSAHDKKKQHA